MCYALGGTSARMALMLSVKPMFSISSASSITTFWMVESETVLRSIRSSRRPGVSYDDVYPPLQGTYLAFDGRTAVHGQYPQTVDVLGVIIQVARYL